jgi:hypothetical protein
MALRAKGTDIFGLVVGTGLRLVVPGVAIGIANSLTARASPWDRAGGSYSARSGDACGNYVLADADGSMRTLDPSSESGTGGSRGRSPLSVGDLQ